MFVARVALVIGISIAALLISLILDTILSPLPPLIQFLVQVPALVLLMDEGRRAVLKEASYYNLTESDVNGTFFFAAPLAAFAAVDLFRDLRRSFRFAV
jgi:hypothetical protein